MKKLLTPEGREAILATARLLKIEPQYCCDGRECGCFGMPINPEHYIVNDVLPEAMKLIGELQVEIRRQRWSINTRAPHA